MKTNEIVTWGIIGCGDVAEVKSGPAFKQCKNSQLLAVMRRDEALARDFATRHNVPLFYTHAAELMENQSITAVYIATPPSSHLDYALKALKAGKHVYIEKPMVLTVDEATTLQNAVQSSTSKLVVAHYRRFLPMYLKVKELIDNHSIGAINFVDLKFLKPHNPTDKAGWRLNTDVSGGGYFHDLAPHQLDLMIYFFGDIQAAHGFAVNQSKCNQVDDLVNGIIQFKNSVHFSGIWSFAAPSFLEQDSCTIYGEHGTISFPFYGETVHLIQKNDRQVFNFKHPKHIQQPLIQETVDFFLGKRNNPCDVTIGVTVIQLMEQFTRK